MAKVAFKNGVTSVILRVKIMDSTSTTGGAKTGLTSASSGLIISTIADNEATATTYTAAGSTTESITTLGTFAAPTATKCRFKEVDATNHPGLYEIQIADARWAVSNARSLIVTVQASGAAQVDAEVQLTQFDLNTATVLLGSAGSVALTESYAADGSAGTLPQLLYLIQQMLTEMIISGTTMTIKKLDGSTTAATLTLNDATTPTGVTRAT